MKFGYSTNAFVKFPLIESVEKSLSWVSGALKSCAIGLTSIPLNLGLRR